MEDTSLVAAVTLYTADGHAVATWSPTGGSSTNWYCYYFLPGAPTGSTLGPDMSLGPIWPPTPGLAYFLYCYEKPYPLGYTWGTLLVYDPANPLGPLNATERALQIALDTVELPEPTITTAPPTNRTHLTGLPTWYWTPTWTTTTATATLAGTTATVTATPTTTTWNPGDHTPTITCEGPGQPWTPTTTATTPACGHTYTTTGTHPLTATITWNITWTSTDPTNPGGNLGTRTTTTTIPITVNQAQAIIGH